MLIPSEQLRSFLAPVPLIADHQDVRIGIARPGNIGGHSGSGELSIAQIIAHHVNCVRRRDREFHAGCERAGGRAGGLAPLSIVWALPIGMEMPERQRHRKPNCGRAHRRAPELPRAERRQHEKWDKTPKRVSLNEHR
jgi:hypothetical protein